MVLGVFFKLKRTFLLEANSPAHLLVIGKQLRQDNEAGFYFNFSEQNNYFRSHSLQYFDQNIF